MQKSKALAEKIAELQQQMREAEEREREGEERELIQLARRGGFFDDFLKKAREKSEQIAVKRGRPAKPKESTPGQLQP